MKKLTLGLTVAALALSGTAYAAPADAPRDGVTTRAEAQARAERMFERLDVNHDGKIDRADREERRATRLNARFDRLDADHDGQISRAEFSNRQAMGQGRHRDGDRAERGPGKHRFAMRGEGRRMGFGRMAGRMADANHDGVVTKAEFTAAAAQRFARLDTNNDGRVTPEERQAMRAQMREQRQDWRGRDLMAPPSS